jgi:hypothetical protein
MTATPKLTALIDKVDNKELVRDQIAAILLVESTGQQALARSLGKDPDLWKLRIYTEASSPWEAFLGQDVDGSKLPVDTSPIVNVWWQSSEDDASASNTVERQKVTAIFNIDCHGYAVSRASEDGHDSGDVLAAREAQRAERLVRNILMAGHYTYLELRKIVWRRWRNSSSAFQPSIDNRAVQNVMGVRMALQVEFNEFSPQAEGQPIEAIALEIKRLSDGLIYLTANYPEPEDP